MVFQIDFPFLLQYQILWENSSYTTGSVLSGIPHADRLRATSKVSLRDVPFD